MRIISGLHKGRKIQAPKKLPVRPTTDRAKESLFNILNNYYNLSEISVIDLCSGTGNIAYEFASRGAQNVIAVDQNRHCIGFIEKTKTELNLNIQCITSKIFNFLEKTAHTTDLIFVDAPYEFTLEDYQKINQLVFDRDLLKKEGMLILEHSKQHNLNEMTNFQEARKYGESVFSFFYL